MIGMQGSKKIIYAVLIFICCNSAFAQSSLQDFYSSLAFRHQARIQDLRITNFFPLTATNYIWGSNTWNFTDTTLYTYTATDKVASLTKKDNANNFTSRILYTYSAADSVTDELHQNWSSGWVNNYRDTAAFDNYNNITLEENHQWSANQWTLAGGYRYFYTYDAGGKFLTKLTVSWNTSTLAWDSVSRITNTYNAGEQITQTIAESYNASAWHLTSKTNYTYDVSFINTQTVSYLWSGSQWVNNTQLINIAWHNWTGDINTSDPLSYIYQLWNGSSWDNYNRITYTYGSFGSVVQLTELFVTGNWRNDSRLSQFYDSQYNYTGIRSEAWDIFTTMWDTSYEYKYIYTYDVNNAILETIYQEYNSPVFVNDSRTVYSDFVLLGIEENTSENAPLKIYPNPAVEFADVTIPPEIRSSFLYRIYDSSGKVIRVGKEENNFRIQRDGLAEGLYLLQISAAKGSNYILKFIVQ